MRTTRSASILAALWLGFSVTASAALREGGTVILKVGEHTFRVPEQYSREAAVPSWLRWLPGLDDRSDEALLIIPADEVMQAIRGYVVQDRKVREDILILLAALNEREVSGYMRPDRHRDMWSAAGEYAERVVEPVDGKLWFRVYRKPTLRSSWELLKQDPEQSRMPSNLSDYWMGTCMRSGTAAKSPDNLEICKTYVVVENLLIEFSVSQRNLDLIDRIKEYVTHRVMSWRTV